MENRIAGLHHITAIAGMAKQNLDFYTKVLGLRLLKKTVNFDDPGTYHFYFGDEKGTPGTILTFFPWEGVQKGRSGTGMATEIGYSVTAGSLSFWKNRFEQLNVTHQPVSEKFGEQFIRFEDPDGLVLNLIATNGDERKGWTSGDVAENAAIKGFHSITLSLRSVTATTNILTDVFGYKLLKKEGNLYRYVTAAIPTANIVDMVEDDQGIQGINAGGTNHHVAFRVKNEDSLMAFREKVIGAGLLITEKIDRNYFYSLYFREPGGVLFEIATDNPGFATDETVSELGTQLKLPVQYEKRRREIEAVLPSLSN